VSPEEITQEALKILKTKSDELFRILADNRLEWVRELKSLAENDAKLVLERQTPTSDPPA
jgi:hypothetical protein